MNPTDLWWKKYEPKTFEEMVLADDVREILQETFTKRPNMMIVGPPGVGKGTFARIFINETGMEHLWINASDHSGIDTIRTTVKGFGRALGLGGLKLIVMNEADRISSAAQEALREEIEFIADITRFMFLVNTAHVFIDPILSRFRPLIEIKKPPVKGIWDHCLKILEAENVTNINKVVLKDIIKELYPDIRGVINTLHMSVRGNILDKAVYIRPEAIFEDVLQAMKAGDVDKIRNVLRSNWVNYPDLYQYLFDNVDKFKSPPGAVLSIGEALRWDSLVAIKEINFVMMVVDMLNKGFV
jgi:replication factor C small subunit